MITGKFPDLRLRRSRKNDWSRRLIEENNLNVIEKLVFPDHYEFSVNEIMNIIEKAKSKNLQIIMTEKDYFKISHFNLDQLEYLKVSLEIEGKDEFLKILNKSYV